MTYEPPSLETLRAEPPPWALGEGGLPDPDENETFISYVSRIGLDVEKLFAGLTDQMAPVANVRLGSLLMQAMPGAYDRYLEELVVKHNVSSPGRRLRRDNLARSLFGARYRTRRSIRNNA